MLISGGWGMGWLLALAAVLALGAIGGSEGAGTRVDQIADRTAKWERHAGLLTTWHDREAGRIWLLVPPPTDRAGTVGVFIYAESLSTGIGNVAVGLDRGEIGRTFVVRLRRVAGRLLFEATNTSFQAVSENPAERASVSQSFPPSILWAGPVEAVDRDGSALVDITSFIVRDARDATAKLADQGGYALDANRSVPDLENCLAFPDNLEFEAILTFGSPKPGKSVTETTPAPPSVTLVQHHSLVRLPDAGYRPRAFDPRCGSYSIPFVNFSAPLDGPLEVQHVERFRLQKADPLAERSRAVKPIVYYLDPGVPEPIRSALLDGARWWEKAFEAAGFIDGFRVEMLPDGVNPLDARYNVLEWIHRTTRGSSFGRTITDPRTGEIIKGHVILDSQRLRQVRLVFEGLAGADRTGSGAPDDPIQLALSRIRQLAAHELGHTLGFAHNFAASSTPDGGSVMDYPAPRVDITPDGDLDFTHAYGVGLGPWDIQAARYSYTEFAPGAEEANGLRDILADSAKRGLLFIADGDTRGAESANPRASMWDNGTDPVNQLQHEMRVRRIALDRFGQHNVKPGTPLARLEETLAPVYFHHRYQVTAALKVIAGIDHGTAFRGDPAPVVRMIDADRQKKALDALLGCLAPAELDVPESVLELLAPRPYESDRNTEMFPSATGPAFDALGAVRSAAEMVVAGLLNPERCARLVDFHRRRTDLPGLEDILHALTAFVFDDAAIAPRLAEVRRATQEVVVGGLIRLSGNATAPLAVRSRVDAALTRLRNDLTADPGSDETQAAFSGTIAGLIGRHLTRPLTASPEPPAAPVPPAGAPLGSWGEDAV
ncbi:MAG TPA: zinc-dependent metalloprotease [Armatimonadota bacterium]|jgi:hypothetical protein